MGLSKKMEEALNKQLNAELFSSFLYLSMAADFQSKNFTGFAAWLEVQSKEENEHALKFYRYILERGGKIKLLTIDAPKNEWQTPLEAFQDTYEHEKKVTNMIYKLLELAIEEKDYATQEMLQWFVKEQVEEEAQTSQIVEQLKIIGESKNGWFMLDHRLGKRKE
jgi:ferritin